MIEELQKADKDAQENLYYKIVEIEKSKNEIFEDAQHLTRKLKEYENSNGLLEEENGMLRRQKIEV